ncbi:MAG: HAMP domain-containing sensor histidine kinase, partial [Patescibacteria group bacterium]
WMVEILVRDEMDFEEGKEKEIHQKIKQELVDLKFALVAPILSKMKVVGLLFLGDKKNKDAFTVQDIQLIDVICSHLGPAIENARLFERTKELLAEVALANKAKSDFIDIVSHQFRAPLSVIRLQAEVLQDSLKKKSALLAAPEQQSLSKIYDQTLFLINLLSEIFDVLAIEGGKLVLDKKARFLWETVDEAVKEFSMAFAQKKIDLVWEREKIAPLETEYDEMKIRNVLKILLNNGLKYTKEGGIVEVKLDKKEIGGKIYSWVTVKDSGVGIHIDDIDKVFAKFFRSEDAKIIAPEGTGLGLYIAKKFVEAHGGKIWLESHLGAGTSAHFILPIA